MRRVRRYILALALALPLVATAQEDDRGFLQGLLEDNLSGAGRSVRIVGFEGALSSEATIERLTIADDTGVWLTLEDVVLNWSRAALLRGQVEVERLSAGAIDLPRLPAAGTTDEAPSPEASGFRLPDLPVSVNIEEIASDRISLGAPVLGQAVEFRLEGSMRLAEGSGQTSLELIRIDGARGIFDLDASFSNSSRELTLDLALEEEPAGIVSTLANLPGGPSVALGVMGSGPLDDFTAELRLATDGQDRLAGSLRIGGDADAAGTPFRAELSGDIAPLFAPDYRAFFGPDISLIARGESAENGALRLDAFDLDAEAIDLSGNLALLPGGTPERFALSGAITARDGTPVLLPISGDEIRIDRADLELSFDGTQSELWTGRFQIAGLDRIGFNAEALTLDGEGIIGGSAGQGGFTTDFEFVADSLDLGDPSAEAALGQRVTGRLSIARQPGKPLEIRTADIDGESYQLRASGTLDILDRDLEIAGTAEVAARDLSVFSGLAARPLAGTAEFTASGRGSLLAGRFDVAADVNFAGLATGLRELDRILAGVGELNLRSARDDSGFSIPLLRLSTDQAMINASARLGSESSNARISARLSDGALLVDGLVGSYTLDAAGTAQGALWDLSATLDGERLAATVNGALNLEPDVPTFAGRVTADTSDLRPLAPLAGLPGLAGAVNGTAEGQLSADLSALDLRVAANGANIRTGIDAADPYLAGGTVLALDVARQNGQIAIRNARFSSPALGAELSGAISPTGGDIQAQVDLDNLGRILPGTVGAARAEIAATRDDNAPWAINTRATGPAGASVAGDGTVAADFGTVDLDLSGTIPLGLANSFIAPRSVDGRAAFDLSVSGAPALESVSGTITTSDARIVAPELGIVIDRTSANIALANRTARLDIDAAVQGGGRIALDGNVGLSPPFNGDLTTSLNAVRITDPNLYETRADGEIRIDGPLAGGASVEGQIDLGRTEIRVPSTLSGSIETIPDITHIGEPADVRATRERAGLVADATSGNGSGRGGPAYPLNVVVAAPNQIFIRGRGLDAELGGRLRVRGTSAVPTPDGRFELIRGRLDVLGQRFNLDEATISLEGDLDPILRIIALTDAGDVTVRIVLEGPATDPVIRFESEPELPEDEVLSRLLFGRGIETLSPLQAAQLASAVATLSGRGGTGLLEQVRQNTGLDDIDITTSEEGETEVAVGKYLSDNIYTDVTVGSEGTAEIELNLDLTPSVTITGRTANTGESGIGIFFERDY